MPETPFKEMLRKKVMELKMTEAGFYSETYNLVCVLTKLSPDAPALIQKRILTLAKMPSKKYNMSLWQMERLYFKYKDDPNLRIRSKTKMNIDDLKESLDGARIELLFFLAFLEQDKKNYKILESVSKGAD